MIRRDFLRKTSLALAGGLLVGPAALEVFERLTWRRKFWPGAAMMTVELTGEQATRIQKILISTISNQRRTLANFTGFGELESVSRYTIKDRRDRTVFVGGVAPPFLLRRGDVVTIDVAPETASYCATGDGRYLARLLTSA